MTADCQAALYGLSGSEMTADEIKFIQKYKPWGFILFSRNIAHRAQLRALTDNLRQITGRENLPILIDQEGGTVARLRPPHARLHPAAAVYGQIYEHDKPRALKAARLGGYLIGQELAALGLSVNCMPCLDVARDETSTVIGTRAYSDNPDTVGKLGRAVADGLMQAGILPVMKHLPGHGRGAVDSHLALPEVDAGADELAASDYVPFKACNDLPLGMTGHLTYTALDGAHVSTQSAIVIKAIRQDIGFDGLLMGDDISMHALTGALDARALLTLEAGCDLVLHCNGDFAEMQMLADALPKLSGKALERAHRVEAILSNRAVGEMEIADAQENWGKLLTDYFP